MVGGDGVGNVLQQHGFASTRRRHDQAALSLAQGREQIHHAGADVFTSGFKFDAFLGIEGRQVVEQNLVTSFVRRLEVDGFNLDQREIFLAFMRRTDLATDSVTSLEIELADLRRRNVNVVRAG